MPPEAPANQKYHDQTPLTRCLAVASAGKKLWAAAQRVPHFYPAEWPVGAVIMYFLLIAGGIYSGFILWLLTSLSGNQLLAVAAPALIAGLEFVLVPIIKYGSLRDKQVAAMKAFVAENRAAQDAATQAASAFGWRDLLVLLILLLCFAATPAARGQPLADKVPADAILYAGWLGYDAKGPGYQGSHLQAVAEAAQFQQLVDETFPKLLQKIADKDRKAAEALGIAKPILLPMLKHPSAVWIGKPELGAGKEPKPRAGLLSQAGLHHRRLPPGNRSRDTRRNLYRLRFLRSGVQSTRLESSEPR